ncbi:MAG: Lysine-tRNA ligase [Candidatus Amesbacteria bacterium GW2011_GWB1_47_26]|uniref:Lysine--tRNA ligase n=1 Tax=Candidatus Amesbacteria bacterium GW2011_GWC2_45_19 TaxID=1618366 RepID=A0A0G1M579_9BACT|nr:MAG: Lysine-tRNA ligase [Candidatus Amesbacteria bacterium GW2011_GWC2_45_19]KKU37767.1 MAG: Lysine-tRNA ligase [Candidatus Amesbacteria bacterium GW2011_GWA1_46_35]KKU69597.1 MAG: Lysine-tRNA ligase [Microgenomates group bacterium GW2011_GWC1_47_20]KKU74401.1 MAG: Lysine-tRNA ligase [Candidatus Amesbacteria bacterium GW2011_GWB1_47_26]KKU79617.1 MAG: Lysine-tRNA ligase [Candidatus Amesbacteria bacterium GW2011_GWA2_47_70]
MSNSRLEEIHRIRLDKLAKLRDRGIDPYPPKSSFSLISIAAVRDAQGKTLAVAGRIWRWREHGNVIFADLRDSSGQIQLLFQKRNLEKNFDLLKLFDVGDFLAVQGEVIKTSAGEITVDVAKFELLSKSLRPLPDDWHGLKNVEERYRKRYLDLLLNPDTRHRFNVRTVVFKETRHYLDKLGFKEVETPVFHPLYGGANARPFTTHMQALDTDFYLRIAFELYLKRLVAGGYDKVYEIGRDFRNEGIDHSHNPEFTMIEWYEAYADYHRVMDVTEGLFKHLAAKIFDKTQIQVGDKTVEIGHAWPRIAMSDLLAQKLDLDVEKLDAQALTEFCRTHKLELVWGETKGQLIFEIFDKLISKDLIEPTWVIDYPADVSPLSKPHRTKSGWTERFEGYIGGREICDGWSELTDPQVQRQRFEIDTKIARKDKSEAQQVDEDFLEAMEYGMPPMGGIGIGMDRLVMFFTNTWSLKEVILFPTLRPENK